MQVLCIVSILRHPMHTRYCFCARFWHCPCVERRARVPYYAVLDHWEAETESEFHLSRLWSAAACSVLCLKGKARKVFYISARKSTRLNSLLSHKMFLFIRCHGVGPEPRMTVILTIPRYCGAFLIQSVSVPFIVQFQYSCAFMIRVGPRHFLHPQSVNFKLSTYFSPWMVYFEKMETHRVSRRVFVARRCIS